MRKLIHAVCWLSLTLVLPALADTVMAKNAGSLPAGAQDLSGDLSLTEIKGCLDFPFGVSMFKIDIADPVDFSAQTVSTTLGVPDTELFLFDSSGLGVYENDDATGPNTLSCLPSAGSGNPCSSSRNGLGPLFPGIYYLAVTRAANLPMSDNGYIFAFGTFSTDVLGPDVTMGGGDPVNSWDNDVDTTSDSELVNYDIQITDSPAIATPEPTAWPFVTAAIAALSVFRRRLRTR